MTLVLRMVRWLLIVPAVILVFTVVDRLGMAISVIAGVATLSKTWIAGELFGHAVKGFLAIALGVVIAPSHRQQAGIGLLVFLALLGALATISSDLPTGVMLVLAAGLLIGGASALLFRKIRALSPSQEVPSV